MSHIQDSIPADLFDHYPPRLQIHILHSIKGHSILTFNLQINIYLHQALLTVLPNFPLSINHYCTTVLFCFCKYFHNKILKILNNFCFTFQNIYAVTLMTLYLIFVTFILTKLIFVYIEDCVMALYTKDSHIH